MKRSIPILLYHHVSPERDMTPARFDAQLQLLAESGSLSLSMDELLRVVHGQATSEVPSFAVTFDDGYANNWEHAFPLINKWKIKTMIYLVTEKIGQDGFLTWDQVRAMADSGLVTFGSHTHTHRHFVRAETYKNLEQELTESKAILESRLGVPCRHLAWPWGDFETSWLPLVQKVGYESSATTLAGANATGSNPYELRRINVRHPETEWLKSRLQWNRTALAARTLGAVYGWDRRLKVWWNRESPYAHG